MRRRDRRLNDDEYRRMVASLRCRAQDCGILATEERSSLAWALALRTHQYWRAWMLMGEAGLRLAETCGLHWRDVMLNGQVVSVLRVSAAIAKGGHEREVPVSGDLAVSLREGWLVELACKVHLEDRGGDIQEERVLRVGRRQVERWVAGVCMQELGREIHPHALRHYAGNRWRRVSGDIAVCQKLLGHIDPKTTMIYTRVGGQELMETVQRASQLGVGGG